jgi:MEMO1 family protein
LPLEVRLPAVAGQFYPSDKDELYEIIHRCFTHDLGPGKFPFSEREDDSKDFSRIEAIIVPHAGYVYSGPIAAHSYKVAFDFFQKFKHEKEIVVIILGPNHYGIGSGVALSGAESWGTPLGRVKVSKVATTELCNASSIIDIDNTSHSREHSIEVQIPFIQAVSASLIDTISIVPISLMLQDFETVAEVADAVLKFATKSGLPSLVIGSCDLTHYEPHEKACQKDLALLAEVESLNIKSFYNVLERKGVSACGYGAIASSMHLSRNLGKTKGRLLKYATSGDTSGNNSAVVGYSSVHFTN